jgi:hypothetical protein
MCNHLWYSIGLASFIAALACQATPSRDVTSADGGSVAAPIDSHDELPSHEEEDVSVDSGTDGERDAPANADIDASADAVVRHAPIYVTINAHGHNYGLPQLAYQGFVRDDNLDGWFALKRQHYQTHRDAIMWLAEETERVGARMSYQLNGEYARDAFTLMESVGGDDTAHLRDLVARGHAMSAHFHPFVLSGADEFWQDVSRRPMTTELMDEIWADHLGSIETALGFGVVRADPAHERDTEALMAHFNDLHERYGLTIENVGENFSATRWAHRPWNTFRRDTATELREDLSGPRIAVHSYPQVGLEAPQGLHFVITTVPQLKRRFVDITLQWLYSQATGQTPRIWTFGIMTHPDSNARYEDEMRDMLAWLQEMTQRESPFGGPIAEFVTDTELAQLHEAWEAESPGTSAFSFDIEAYEAGETVPYPYDLEGMVLATHDGEFTGFLDAWEAQDVMAVELVHRHVDRSDPQPNGAVTTTVGELEEALYLLWTPSEPVVIDMSAAAGPALFQSDGVTGAVERIDGSAVTVTRTPQVVSVTDAYFGVE